MDFYGFIRAAIIIILSACALSAQSRDSLLDLRHRKNIPEYDASLNPLSVNSQSKKWTELNPRIPRVHYAGLHFFNPDTGLIVGTNGAIIKTTDGGLSWQTIPSLTSNTLLKVNSFNDSIVIVSGFDGLILRSTDGGGSFNIIPTGLPERTDLWQVQMINDTLGWICGLNNTLLKTIDGGLSWNKVYTPLGNAPLWDIEFYNEKIGFIAGGYGAILKTTDGGENWDIIQTAAEYSYYCIDVIDSLHIAAAGEWYQWAYSSDAGTSWKLNNEIYFVPNAITFLNPDTGYAVSAYREIIKTTNRGESWAEVKGGGGYDIQFLPDGTGYAAGEYVKIYKRTGGLENWKELILNEDWSDVFFITEEKGFFLQNERMPGLYITEDGGRTLNAVPESPIGYDILFLDSLTGFIGSRDLDHEKIFKTTDGGLTWKGTNSKGEFQKIYFIDDLTGWAAGNSGIAKTTDGGENWVYQIYDDFIHYKSIFFLDSLYGWAVSQYPWYTTDGGKNWYAKKNISLFCDDIFFINKLNGWIIAENYLFYTSDGGVNWVNTNKLNTLISKFGKISNEHFLIHGSNVYETKDVGLTWQNITGEVGAAFGSFSAPKKYIGYGAGALGYIVQYIDSSALPVELTIFEGKIEGNNTLLYWQTASELNNQGFTVEKSFDKNNWFAVGFVKARGTSSILNNYSFKDIISPGVSFYRLKQNDFDGSFQYSGIIEVDGDNAVSEFSLSQNYPNPANPATKISFSIKEQTAVSISLYSVTGEKLKDIINDVKERGSYTIEVDLRDFASGMYFYKMTTKEGYTRTRKLILLK